MKKYIYIFLNYHSIVNVPHKLSIVSMSPLKLKTTKKKNVNNNIIHKIIKKI
jgi:hypothetical protein